MEMNEYRDARKRAMKEYRARISHGENPYLPVLDEILKPLSTGGELSLGLREIPLDFVVGTRTKGRTTAFAGNFLPLLEAESEFAEKWQRLCEAHVEEGIREPIKVYEFLNRFYVQEGNKRVSVLKYYNATSVYGYVTRILPARNEIHESKLYYEFAEFFDLTGIFDIEFSKLGRYEMLLAALGYKKGDAWTDEDTIQLSGTYHYFEKQYRRLISRKITGTVGDAFLIAIRVYGFETLKQATDAQLAEIIEKIREEIATASEEESMDVVLEPETERKQPSVLTRAVRVLLPSGTKTAKAAFLYEKAPEESSWIYRHEQGRKYLEEHMEGRVTTTAAVISDPEQLEERIRALKEEGYQTFFVVSPQMIDTCAHMAVEFPHLHILNCSLNIGYHSVPTYYTRIYEAKFLAGVVAGCMATDGKIGYLADYPIYGTISGVNAFALGARMVNPRAKVYLSWTCLADRDPMGIFRKEQIDIISGVDAIRSDEFSKEFGLYMTYGDHREPLLSPVWNWGVFYERLMTDILEDSFRHEQDRSVNFWWGMSAGVTDVLLADLVPKSTKQLITMFRKSIIANTFNPMYGTITDQDGVEHEGGDGFSVQELIEMDWLADNVIGSIPKQWAMTHESVELINVSGVNAKKTE